MITNALRYQAADINVDRAAIARENFVGILMNLGDLDAATAGCTFEAYVAKKFVKYDFVNSRYTVKHGALLDKDAIRAVAASLAC